MDRGLSSSPPTWGSLKVGPHLGTRLNTEGSLKIGASLPDQMRMCVARRESSESCAPMPSVPRISKATHQDVKEGSFKAVVDDLLLQVLLDACVGLKREMWTALQAEPSPQGCPLFSQRGRGREGEKVEPGGEAVNAQLPPKKPLRQQGSSARDLRPQHYYRFSKDPGSPDRRG